jgi:hypothetical protein
MTRRAATGDVMGGLAVFRRVSMHAALLCAAGFTFSPAEGREEIGYVSGTITSQITGAPVGMAGVEAYATPSDRCVSSEWGAWPRSGACRPPAGRRSR